MNIQHTYLRRYRKKSRLTQGDLSYILDQADYSNVSRWESGGRLPNIEVLLMYHLVFDIPIESFFERQKHEMLDSIIKRIGFRMEELRTLKSDDKLQRRIAFLDSVLNRLIAPVYPTV